jgi:hypothetical protein
VSTAWSIVVLTRQLDRLECYGEDEEGAAESVKRNGPAHSEGRLAQGEINPIICFS